LLHVHYSMNFTACTSELELYTRELSLQLPPFDGRFRWSFVMRAFGAEDDTDYGWSGMRRTMIAGRCVRIAAVHSGAFAAIDHR
ncbi:hypothetical protein NX865_11805, partial [Burkholderia thailandensis]|uniref:hypothetical protein n=1 Tax=Burkholderia thailandensis TaxID=57975 RepID=UPI00217E4DD0